MRASGKYKQKTRTNKYKRPSSRPKRKGFRDSTAKRRKKR